MSTAPPEAFPKSYVAGDHEPGIRDRWARAQVFHATLEDPGDPFCVLIPPPNVTAALHLGHAFNNTLQDVLVRARRMQGRNTLWMPGTDHAGIATQAVVEKRLTQEGSSRRELGREAFVDRVQAWKDEYEQTITEQLQMLGASCDWDRQRFTMDPVCARAVREAFFRLFRDDLIYRGKRLVNWDPVTQTALADDEVEMRDVDSSFWYLRYPLVDDAGAETGEHVVVATTRPETMLGDTAVAVNPGDPDRKHLIGRSVRLPIVGRVIPIVGDDYVVQPDPQSDDAKAKFASGFLKVTPAHDPNDWEIGQRHDLEAVNVMAPDGSISTSYGWDDAPEAAQPFVGLGRDEARAKVVAWFEANGLLAETRPYRHAVGHSYRSHAPIEPYLSDQWYVRVSDDRLVGEAQRALDPAQTTAAAPIRSDGAAHPDDGGLRFHPNRYARTYESWHAGLRDWCVSRQLWWGHRIPVWAREVAPNEQDALADIFEGAGAALTLHEPHRSYAVSRVSAIPDSDALRVEVCIGPDHEDFEALLGDLGFEQDPDVLDTWFSSALWPISTMGWPDPAVFPETLGLLETFVPTSVLSTAREIITLWVSRMVMFTRYFYGGRIPFRDVSVHAMIQDGHGQKMSKSLGNGVDPRDCIHTHGTDALRFTMVQMATNTQDVRMPVAMLCPHCDAAFDPQEFSSPAGYRVAAPEQTCPACKGRAISGYGVASGSASATDAVPLARNTSPRFDLGRNFANKLWNATRFALGNVTPTEEIPDLTDLALADRWIITRLHRTLHQVEDAIDSFQFSAYAEAMYDFIWRDFCDWYLEAIKPTVRDRPSQQHILRTVLNAALRMLHPVMPFVTEALLPHVEAAGPAGMDDITLAPVDGLLAGAAWPDIACSVDDPEALALFERAQALAGQIRTIRSEHRVPPRREITFHARPGAARLVAESDAIIRTLAGIAEIHELGPDDGRPDGAIAFAFDGEELFLTGLVDAVDAGKERQRLDKLIAELEGGIKGFSGKLQNAGYVQNAPAAVVEETRRRLAQAESDLQAARSALAAIESSSITG